MSIIFNWSPSNRRIIRYKHNLKRMHRFWFSILFLVLAYSQNHIRLNTKQSLLQLPVDEALISTMGHFKAILRKTNCRLEISQFNQSSLTYDSRGFYQSPLTSEDCSYLQVREGKVVSSSGDDYMVVSGSASYNDSTILTIDDLGVIRLIGTYIKFNRVDQESFEFNVTTFQTTNTYFTAASHLNVRFTDSFGPLVNERGWIYLAEFGQLDIYYGENPGLIKNYVYSRFKFNNSQIQDFNSDTFPAAIFPEIKFPPRCAEPRSYLNFKPPFVLHADPYWPRVTVLEQGGYKILEVNYAQYSEFNFQQEQMHINSHKEFSVCPDETFQHRGDCLPSCPEPYYHEMRGKRGTCVLVCEEHTPIDEENRICTCMGSYEADHFNSQYIKECSSEATVSPYGCYCSTEGQYYDKKLTFSCVSSCPEETFPMNGMCADCPAQCKTCQRDNFFRMMLECTECKSGYTLRDGQCFKTCNQNLGESIIGGACTQCVDQNCVDCSDNPSICKKCSTLYTLSDGSCVNSCPANFTQVNSDFFATECLPETTSTCEAYLTTHYKDQPYLKCDQCSGGLIAHLDGCVSQCPIDFKRYDFQGFSYCTCVAGMSINDRCIEIPGCPVKMYYDRFSASCLSCPFGCTSCVGSVCTSCSPGYFLYVSPQAVICRRDSPLFACDQQYALTNGVCLVQDYANLQMTLCRSAIPNCKVCPFQRNDVCVVCEEGYYHYNNTCVSSCPDRFIVYENIACLMTEIQNCQEHHLESIRQAAILNITYIENNDPYSYYIFNNLEPANDPVGYIPYFQKITSSRRVTDGLYRETSFFGPRWTCLKCEDGYGLSEDFKTCLPCVSPCVNCYMARNDSCLDDDQDDNHNNTTGDCRAYTEFQTGECIQSCNQTNSYPELQNGTLYCKTAILSNLEDVVRIDSAIYAQEDGSKIAYFVFENDIPAESNVTVRIQSASRRRLLQEEAVFREEVVQLKDRNYFQVLSGPNEDVFVANFTESIRELQSVEGYLPPNLVYGSVTTQTHPEFMKTWLAYIGYIMSVVILAMHCIYVGNQLLYKMDNLLILVQTIYFFSFVKILVGRLLAQFYYGWIYSHVGFFPNFFGVPDQHRENEAPISYKLATTDANFIRNAGFSISFLLVYLGALAIVTLLAFVLSKVFHKKQVWHPKIAKSALIAGVELVSFNVMYWAIAHLLYREECQNCDESFHKANLAWSIIFVVVISAYSLIRFFFNAVGGLYMLKRVFIAIILPAAFDDLRFIAPLLILEALFVVFRFVIERPEFTKQKIFILVEFGAALLVYLLLFLCTNAGVNTIIISIVIFIFIVALMSDFMEVYLESVNEWDAEPDNRYDEAKSGFERAQTDQNVITSEGVTNRY